jgi:hypothetical protein
MIIDFDNTSLPAVVQKILRGSGPSVNTSFSRSQNYQKQ